MSSRDGTAHQVIMVFGLNQHAIPSSFLLLLGHACPSQMPFCLLLPVMTPSFKKHEM